MSIDELVDKAAGGIVDGYVNEAKEALDACVDEGVDKGVDDSGRRLEDPLFLTPKPVIIQ